MNSLDLSTSAQLTQTQRDLAASQEDLTQALAARDEANANFDQLANTYAAVLKDRDLARAELASARTELERLRAELATGLADAYERGLEDGGA